MRLLVEFSHPAQVHKFKHVLRELMERGHAVLILSRDKDVMLPLLDAAGLPHVCISRARSGLLRMGLELGLRELRTLWQLVRFRPTLVLSAHSVAVVHAGWLFGVPRIVHDDTEHASLQHALQMPFASHIVTTSAYRKDWGRRQVRIESLEPLAYLHPARFEPDPAALRRYGLEPGTFAVVRLIAWQAAHDAGIRSESLETRYALVERLLDLGARKVVLASEVALPIDASRVVVVRPEHFHDVLARARLCLSEGGSVAMEAAVLGVPTVLVNPIQCGPFDELERYGLIEHCGTFPEGAERAAALWADAEAPPRWRQRRERLLAEKIDMSSALRELIEDVASGKETTVRDA